MIKTLRLNNFKAFQDTGEIELKPITILAGPNSGGKSSILQSLLLLRQTLGAPPDVSLNLSGRFLQFSRFNELAFGKPSLQTCNVGYKFKLETEIPTKYVRVYFPNVEIIENENAMLLQSSIEFSFRYKEVGDGNKQVVLHQFNVSSRLQDTPGPQLFITFRDKRYRVKLEGSGVGLPEPYEEDRIEDVAVFNFLPRFFVIERPAEDDRPKRTPLLPLAPIFFSPINKLGDELESDLHYLGPLRAEPQRAYLHSASPSPEIGQKGEFAAQILWLEKDKEVEFIPGLGEEIRKATLLEAVSHVFQNLGIAQPIDVRTEKSIVYQILFRLGGLKSRKKVTIADVGFGVSQLLPIVVMSLRATKSSILLLEQPEIHLHPSVQAKLADFLLTVALSGIRVLVETHSDHFINRVRRRIAEDPNDNLKDQVNILFVHPPQDGQSASIEPMKLDRYGIIENWPPDFLPEAADEAEAIFRAGLEKRQERE